MKKVIVIGNQTLFDIAIQETGTPSNALIIAKENNLILSEEIAPGYEILISETLLKNRELANYYGKHNILTATGLTQQDTDLINSCEGVECWYIENDFIVS